MADSLARLERHLEDPEQGVENDISFHLAVAAATQQSLRGPAALPEPATAPAVGAARANSRQQAGLSVAVHQEHVAVFEAIRAQDAAAARHAAVGTFGKPPRDCSWRWRRTRRSAPLSRHRPDSFLTRPTFHR